MNFDDLFDSVHTWTAANFPGSRPIRLRVDLDDGRKIDVAVPECCEDDSPERHPVETAILDVLQIGIRVAHKELKNKVLKVAKCSLPTFNRYLRRLKDDEAIDVTVEGYAVASKK